MLFVYTFYTFLCQEISFMPYFAFKRAETRLENKKHRFFSIRHLHILAGKYALLTQKLQISGNCDILNSSERSCL